MDEKSLYAHILSLSAPWQVKSLSLDENAGSVTVTVGIAENTQLTCPTCGKSCPVHDHRHRKWRHLDTCQFATIVEASVPRIMCPKHGCQTLPVPWAGSGSRYTLLFESFVLSWLKISTVDAVRKQLKLSWNAVDGIMTRAVKRGLARIKKPLAARHMNVDEVAFKKGHRYITVISDRDGRALALTDDRGKESLAGYLRTLTDRQLQAIKTLSMDMKIGEDPCIHSTNITLLLCFFMSINNIHSHLMRSFFMVKAERWRQIVWKSRSCQSWRCIMETRLPIEVVCLKVGSYRSYPVTTPIYR